MASSIARSTVGCGCTCPSEAMIPNKSLPGTPSACDLRIRISSSFSCRQGSSSTFGSDSHGFADSRYLNTSRRPSGELDIRPMAPPEIGSPRKTVATPLYGKRPSELFNDQSPLNALGIRLDPATSVPMPRGEPLRASRAPSPAKNQCFDSDV